MLQHKTQQAQIAVLVVNYGISNTNVLEIPYFIIKPAKYRKQTRLWPHKSYPISHPDGRAIRIYHEKFGGDWLGFFNSWLSGKLWYLQHNCVGDTIVYPYEKVILDLLVHDGNVTTDDLAPDGAIISEVTKMSIFWLILRCLSGKLWYLQQICWRYHSLPLSDLITGW